MSSSKASVPFRAQISGAFPSRKSGELVAYTRHTQLDPILLLETDTTVRNWGPIDTLDWLRKPLRQPINFWFETLDRRRWLLATIKAAHRDEYEQAYATQDEELAARHYVGVHLWTHEWMGEGHRLDNARRLFFGASWLDDLPRETITEVRSAAYSAMKQANGTLAFQTLFEAIHDALRRPQTEDPSEVTHIALRAIDLCGFELVDATARLSRSSGLRATR